MEAIFLAITALILWQLYKKGLLTRFLNKSITPRESAPRENLKQERIASDGHIIPARDDISCARFGHRHEKSRDPEFPEEPFIVHDEPTEGYINLNGKTLKRSEADEYMRKHG
ncbi:MAG: hypothetical protein K5696_01880 [Lachnospiraceae bacterium]|nr:hypothetical protein [Lachnospiraceae bacterium]